MSLTLIYLLKKVEIGHSKLSNYQRVVIKPPVGFATSPQHPKQLPSRLERRGTFANRRSLWTAQAWVKQLWCNPNFAEHHLESRLLFCGLNLDIFHGFWLHPKVKVVVSKVEASLDWLASNPYHMFVRHSVRQIPILMFPEFPAPISNICWLNPAILLVGSPLFACQTTNFSIHFLGHTSHWAHYSLGNFSFTASLEYP